MFVRTAARGNTSKQSRLRAPSSLTVSSFLPIPEQSPTQWLISQSPRLYGSSTCGLISFQHLVDLPFDHLGGSEVCFARVLAQE